MHCLKAFHTSLTLPTNSSTDESLPSIEDLSVERSLIDCGIPIYYQMSGVVAPEHLPIFQVPGKDRRSVPGTPDPKRSMRFVVLPE